MDPFYIDTNHQDSRQCRSRSNSHLSVTATDFQGLNILDSSDPRGTSPLVQPTSSRSRAPSIQSSQDRFSTSTSFISAPAPRQLTPFPILTRDELDWTFGQSEEHQRTAPLLRVDPAQPHEQSDPVSSYRPGISSANMSTIGIQQQFDPHFEAGYPSIRPSYTWPPTNFDMSMNQPFLPQIPSSGLTQGTLTPFNEPKHMSHYARSLSSSPPRGSLTPEQRELKRQRDHARRDSKTRIRRERSSSNPYVVSHNGSPDLLPGTLPEYSSSLTPSPLLSQDTPTLGNTSYMTNFSPQLGSTCGSTGPSNIYAPVYSMGGNDFTSIPAYSMPYSNSEPMEQPQVFLQRPHSLSSASDRQQYQPQQQQQQQLNPLDSLTASSTSCKLESGDHVRVVHSRPKPQCWEHGCNGRQFSTFSNLLRHQREKSGAATKSSCPNCGAEFTRTTARNGHIAHEKCKQRRNS